MQLADWVELFNYVAATVLFVGVGYLWGYYACWRQLKADYDQRRNAESNQRGRSAGASLLSTHP